jgi:hypothetical protein
MGKQGSDMSTFPREATGLDQVEAGMEGELRDFVRRDFGRPDSASARRAPEPDGDAVAGNISALLQRVSLSSVQEIDRLIHDLTLVRERLHQEGERVQRQIVQYASLSQAAMQSTKIIADSLNRWKKPADAPRFDEGA